MKVLPLPVLVSVAVFSLLVGHAFGQGAQADQIKRRARELSNQNNVRQGVPPPAPPRTPPPAVPKPFATNSTARPSTSVSRLQADIAALKAGSPATTEQKQQLIKDMIAASRTVKPSAATVATFVNDLTAALASQPLKPEQQSRLAQSLEAVLNNRGMSASQLNSVIADVQATLQAGGAKRNLAISAAERLKAVGLEVRGGAP